MAGGTPDDATSRGKAQKTLLNAWVDLLENNTKRAEMGAAARQIVEHNRGATAATLDRLAAIIEPHRAHT